MKSLLIFLLVVTSLLAQKVDYIKQVTNKPLADPRDTYGAVCNGSDINPSIEKMKAAGITDFLIPKNCVWVVPPSPATGPKHSNIPAGLRFVGENGQLSIIRGHLTDLSYQVNAEDGVIIENMNVQGASCSFRTACYIGYYYNGSGVLTSVLMSGKTGSSIKIGGRFTPVDLTVSGGIATVTFSKPHGWGGGLVYLTGYDLISPTPRPELNGWHCAPNSTPACGPNGIGTPTPTTITFPTPGVPNGSYGGPLTFVYPDIAGTNWTTGGIGDGIYTDTSSLGSGARFATHGDGEAVAIDQHPRIDNSLPKTKDSGVGIKFSRGSEEVGPLMVAYNASLAQTMKVDKDGNFIGNSFNGIVGYVSVNNGGNNNLVIPSNNIIALTGATAPFNVSGFAGGYPGRMITVVNRTNATVSFLHQDSSSSAVNQLTMSGANLTFGALSSTNFVYDGVGSRWQMLEDNKNFIASTRGLVWGSSLTDPYIAGSGVTTAGKLSFNINGIEQMAIDVNGVRAVKPILADITQITVTNGATNHNLAIGNNTDIFLVGATAPFSIDGFTGGVQGRSIKVINYTNQRVTWLHQTAGSTTSNQLDSGGAPITAGPFTVTEFVYNILTSKWQIQRDASLYPASNNPIYWGDGDGPFINGSGTITTGNIEVRANAGTKVRRSLNGEVLGLSIDGGNGNEGPVLGFYDAGIQRAARIRTAKKGADAADLIFENADGTGYFEGMRIGDGGVIIPVSRGIYWGSVANGPALYSTGTATTGQLSTYINGVAKLAVSASGVSLLNSVNSLWGGTNSPASTGACSLGQTTFDANFIYVCTATNTWKRATLATY